MVVFFNTIDIAAINTMTIRLSQNTNWGGNYTHIHRLFLLELRESLTTAHNDRRSHQSRLSHTQASPIQNDSSVATKKRCYLCPHHPGRKVRQTCNICHGHVCNSHVVITRTIICTTREDNLSEDQESHS